MGVSIDTGGGSGKKSLDAELNLVPFIDLLVCCICFLLITAVWTQMARIEVNQKGKGSSAKKEDKPPEMQVKITILVGEDGYTVTSGGERLVIAKKGNFYDTAELSSRLRDIKARLPEKKDLTVAVEDGIQFDHIIKAMDVAIGERFSAIRLSDASAAN